MYGQVPDDIEEKIRYGKWRAAEIMRAASLPSFSGTYPSTEGGRAAPAVSLETGPSAEDLAVKLAALAQAEKAARQAVSALMFEDVHTAADCLERALGALAPFKQ